MVQLLGLVVLSFIVTSLLLIPFIDLLFYIKKKNKKKALKEIENSGGNIISQDTPIHHQLLIGKDLSVPIGGGLLIIPILVILSTIVLYIIHPIFDIELYVLVFSTLTFGLIGFLDDSKKIFASISGKYGGIKARHLFVLQLIAATTIALLLYFSIGLNNIFIPLFGNIVLGVFYIPLVVLVIVSFTNAYNISDGLDGLSTGLLLICLLAFLVLAHSVFDQTLGVFVGIWIGALIAYLYFNVYPARVYLGDAGAFAFGATLAVVGLLTGKIIGLAVIGGVYVIIVTSSLLQIASKKFFHRKVFPVAPIHMYFKYIGWEEPKIVVRFWLVGAIFAILGLWLSLLSH